MFIITSTLKNIRAINDTISDPEYYNQLFNTTDCVVTEEVDPLTQEEKEALIAQRMEAIKERYEAKAQAIIDNLPSWAIVGGKFDAMLSDATAATNLAQAKAVLIELIKTCKKIARVEYWIAKDTEK